MKVNLAALFSILFGSLYIPTLTAQQLSKHLPPSYYSSPIDTVMSGDTLRTQVQLYFRWDKDVIDSTYMSNTNTLRILDELLSIHRLKFMDSIRIKAYASPEGHPDYNYRLSQRRGRAIKTLLLNRFSHLESTRIDYSGMGENWNGLRKAIEMDPNVPSRDKLLQLLKQPLSDLERDKRMQAMDGGVPYKYLYRTFYKQLRNASSIYIDIIPKPISEVVPPLTLTDVAPPLFAFEQPFAAPMAPEQATYRYIRPIAIKTNLLFDALIMPNIEIEVPIGKRFSVMAEWTFPFWGGLGNAGGVAPVPVYSEKFTMQMLSGGLEARYWFPRSESLERKATQWGDYNPLTGFFVGLYGGAGMYDFQFGGNGMQGDFYIASGISAGYAHPIGKYFHMEYSLGIGYLATKYYRYQPLDGHKVVIIRPDGRYDFRKQSLVGPTKAKISLVWIPRFKVKRK